MKIQSNKRHWSYLMRIWQLIQCHWFWICVENITNPVSQVILNFFILFMNLLDTMIKKMDGINFMFQILRWIQDHWYVKLLHIIVKHAHTTIYMYHVLFKNQCIKNILIQNSVCYQTITLAAANIVRKCDGELQHTTFRLYISAAVDAAR